MNNERRQILTQVAAGTMTPAEAASRLEEVDRGQAREPAGRTPASTAEISGVRVVSSFGRLIVTGDDAIDQAVAEGPHVARHENGILVIETDHSSDGDFWFGGRGGRWWEGFIGPTVTVRMNPRLQAWITSDAGSVTARNLLGPVHAEVQAGSLLIQGFTGPLDLVASAGSVRAEGTLKEGISRIRCEMGSVRVTLDRDSDVRVIATTSMGKVSLDGGTAGAGKGRSWGGRQEALYGAGIASLEISAEMGSVVVGRRT